MRQNWVRPEIWQAFGSFGTKYKPEITLHLNLKKSFDRADLFQDNLEHSENFADTKWHIGRTRLPMQETQETQETRVQSLSREGPPEEGMATYSSILAWRIPWTEEPDGLQAIGQQRVRHD